MRHSIGSKPPVTRGKILSPPRGTHKEFASSKLAATARVGKRKSSKKSIPGTSKPSPSTMKVTTVLPKQPMVSTGDDKEQSSTNIPAVPVLRSLPPYGLHVHQAPPTTQIN